MKYVNVAIDNNSDHTDELYTYASPFDEIRIGNKVTVPFARGNKTRDAYVFEVKEQLEEEIKGLKSILEIDSEISLSEEAISTSRWMRQRYLCKYIDGVKCFLPAGTSSKRGKQRNPLSEKECERSGARELTEEQKMAMEHLNQAVEIGEHKVILIHGVTSSGKTELYLQMIEQVLAKGKTAIMMVPEISLTTQTIQRFISRFGKERTAVLHSKLSLGERYDEWTRIRKGEAKIVVGARSAVFAPLDHIGVIILDEEHETSYKSDKTPKYDTMEVAVKRTMVHKGIVVLGSATPSLISTYRSKTGAFDYISLKNRYNKNPLPQVEIAGMREELKQGNHSMFSMKLLEQMKHCLEKKQQIILFLNRRGYSTFVFCRSCGYTVKCPDCGITMTYHKSENACFCHFCGKKQAIPKVCPDCGSSYVKYFGTGTEKVEEVAQELFPEAVIQRLDLDTVKKKGSTDKIISAFQKGKTDILIGTQIVAKGLDFSNVGLVGIISADVTLNIPDFRSAERTFQLITQAAGRAGRGEDPGKVVIQTYSPDHYAVEAASKHDYEGFYEQEISLRYQIDYPPFCDLFQLIVAGEEEGRVQQKSRETVTALRQLLGETAFIMGPAPAPMPKINDTYRYQIILKAPLGRRRSYAEAVMQMKKKLFTEQKSACLLHTDVNPFSFV